MFWTVTYCLLPTLITYKTCLCVDWNYYKVPTAVMPALYLHFVTGPLLLPSGVGITRPVCRTVSMKGFFLKKLAQLNFKTYPVTLLILITKIAPYLRPFVEMKLCAFCFARYLCAELPCYLLELQLRF